MRALLPGVGGVVVGLFGLTVIANTQTACGPEPTKASYIQRRTTPFFKVLVYEHLETLGTPTSVLLFEDEAGGCYITSGVDGGVVMINPKSCEAAKHLPAAVELPK